MKSNSSSNKFLDMITVKSLSTAFGYTAGIIATIFLLSCSKASTPQPASQQDMTKTLLTSATAAAPWKIQSSSVDGVDQSALYNGFTIAFTSSSFTTANGGGIWPASGTWNFQGTDATTITRNDGVPVQIQITSSSLVMTINWTKTTLGSGRTESTSGKNVFTMAK
jgi:hypothetical protein